jgi:lipoprotein-anchoring transpeptidase ErfK/SrfK
MRRPGLAISEDNMLRHFAALPAAALAAALAASPGWATQFDPQTGLPLVYHPGAHAEDYTPIPRQEVPYAGKYAPGTIVVDTSERRLYLIEPGGKALRYGVGVGRDGFQWSGVHHIIAKREWPGWTPPPQMLRRQPDLPRYMEGGPNNPLGARALYIGSTLYRIHGSNQPWTIGQAMSSGCIRMTNADVIDLYSRVKVGTEVVVKR